MVGLVVVSHSPALAQAAVALAMEMVPDRPPRVAVAAGGPDGDFGTNAVVVQAAIEQVDDGDGVVVLMDLGSAVLSSEFALDLLDPELRKRVHLTAAPLVEGLVAAVVQAAAGESPQSVIREAAAGLYGKQAQLGAVPDTEPTPEPDHTAERAIFTITTPHGLHARPAARLVTEARRFDAVVQIRNTTTDSNFAPATSLSRVAAIGARKGHEIEVRASGRERGQALESIVALAARDFDERPAAAAPVSSAAIGEAMAASPGIAIGPKWSIDGGDIPVPDGGGDLDPESEARNLRAAVAATRHEIAQARARLLDTGDESSAAIFDVHLLLLNDDEINEQVRADIEGGVAAAAGWKTAMQRVEREWAQLDDPYLNARAADVHAVCNQVLRQLLGTHYAITSQPGILVAADLTPNDIAQLDADLVTGIVTAHGSPTSHAVILAKALGIPAVVGAGEAVLDVADGTEMIVAGTTGNVLIDPSAETVRTYRAEAEQLAAASAATRSRAREPAATTDGTVIEVATNIAAISDVPGVVASGADAVGVLRTEFLFIDRAQPPTAAEQEAQYRHIAAGIGGRRLTIRTLDAGGDKPLDYLRTPREGNPFLGLRGIRLSLCHPELLREQLTAAVRVAQDHPISVMFPMVTAVAELDQALAMLAEVCGDNGGRPEGLEVGMMVEVPAVALNAAAFTRRVDFVSIGTNDLAQYALAAERGNQHVAHLADALDPGLLRLIESVAAAAGTDTRVAVCGELAADLAAVPVLIGLGVGELSVTRLAVPAVKDEVRKWSQVDAASLAAEVMDLESAAEVRSDIAARQQRGSA
jgi:phosphocarrier protein FPr